MTFPGESLSVDSYTNVSGAPVGSIEAIQLRAGSSTFAAGDSVELSSDLLWQYLGPSDPVVVSWVVEVLSGSGTLTFSEGMGDTGTSLGSQSVTGPATVVVPSVAIDAADVYSGTDARLLLGCTSGTLEVQQVKLRVWPPEGAAGAWSDTYPSWQIDGAIAGTRVQRSFEETTFTNAGAAADWSAAIAAGQAHADEPWASGATFQAAPHLFGSLATIRADENIVDGTSSGAFQVQDLAAVVVDKTPGEGGEIDPSLGLVEGVDWVVPPTEVAWDAVEVLDSTGERSSAWLNVGVHVKGDTGTEGAATITAQPAPADLENLASWPDTGATVLAYGDNALATPAGDRILFAGSHLWMTNAPDFPGGTNVTLSADWQWALGVGDPDTPEFQPLSYRVTYPPYRVWNPAAIPTETLYPLRLIRRGDGLGMGSGRVLSTGTRQNSTRVFGVL